MLSKPGLDVNPKYIPYLARVFSPVVISQLATDKKSELMAGILSECEVSSQLEKNILLRDCFDQIYGCIQQTYRNEYIYKNALANQVLLKVHSLSHSFMLTEFRAVNCKADVVILNGTSHVYEIKTELDTLDRLSKQIDAYEQVFDYINVIASEDQAEKIQDCVSEDIGLLVLTKTNTIDTLRPAASRKTKTSQEPK